MATLSFGRILHLSSRGDGYSWWRNYVMVLVMTIIAERMIGQFDFKIIEHWITENLIPPRQREYKEFWHNQCGCNKSTKKQGIAKGWTIWVSSPGEGAIFRTYEEGPRYPFSRQYHARHLSRGKIGGHFAPTTNLIQTPGSSMGRAKPLVFCVGHITGQLFLYLHRILQEPYCSKVSYYQHHSR
jgi:hypothetical protein